MKRFRHETYRIFNRCSIIKTLFYLDNSDVTLPAVDPRTISPSGIDEYNAAEDTFVRSKQNGTNFIQNKNLFHVNINNDEDTKIEKKMIIKARRNIKPKVNHNFLLLGLYENSSKFFISTYISQ